MGKVDFVRQNKTNVLSRHDKLNYDTHVSYPFLELYIAYKTRLLTRFIRLFKSYISIKQSSYSYSYCTKNENLNNISGKHFFANMMSYLFLGGQNHFLLAYVMLIMDACKLKMKNVFRNK